MRVKLTLTEEALGTCASPEIHKEYIASKAPDAPKMEEEIEALGIEAVEEKGKTVFPKENGIPFFWDYQIKGFIKDNINALRDIEEISKTWGVELSKRLGKWQYKRTVDNLIFVFPRKIMLHMPEGSVIGNCQRSLRVMTPQGERVALASSETVPEGTWFEMEITCLDSRLEKVIPQLLDYGKYKGLGQWRNSGKGRFIWEEI